MLYTTRGIVIHPIRYGDSSLIVKILTEQFGLKSYIFKGVFKARSKNPASLFQHLNLIELVSDEREYGGLQHPREVRMEMPYHSMHTDILKSSVCLFINELLHHALKHEETDPGLFDFLHHHLARFDQMDRTPPDFHLWMTVHLSKFLGFFPELPPKGIWRFDLREGWFTENNSSDREAVMSVACTNYFLSLMEMLPAYDAERIGPERPVRDELLNALLYFYRFHIEDFGEVHSHKVLSEIFC